MTQNITVKLGLSGLTNVTAGLQSLRTGLTNTFGGITRMLGPLAALAGTALGLGAVVKGIKGIVDEGGKLHDLSIRTNTAVASLVRLGQVFSESGSSMEAMGPVFDRTAKAIHNAATEGGAAAETFAMLGLNAADLAKQSPEEAFLQIGTALGKIENSAQRTAIAMQIWGRSGGEILPVLDALKDISKTDAALGRLPEILGRSAGVLDDIGDAFGRLGLKSKQFFAGLFDVIGPAVRDVLDSITSIDLTQAGQNVGAFLTLLKLRFQQGRVAELIGDLIEAGFEVGIIAVKKLFGVTLGTASFWKVLENGLATAFTEGIKLAITAAIKLVEVLTLGMIDAAEWFGKAFRPVFNSVLQNIVGQINALFLLLSAKFPFLFSPTTFTAPKLKDSDYTKGAKRLRDDSRLHLVNAEFKARKEADDNLAKFRTSAGIGGGDRDQTSALDRLGKALGGINAANEFAAVLEGKKLKLLAGQADLLPVVVDWRKQERDAMLKVRDIHNEMAGIESDFRLTEAEKFRKRLAALEKERQALDLIISRLRWRQELTNDPKEREELDKAATSREAQRDDVEARIKHREADPNSLAEQLDKKLTDLQDRFGTVAENIADMFTGTIGGAFDNLSSGLNDLIWQTTTWRDVLRNVAKTLTGEVIKGLTDMFGAWITGLIKKAAITEATAAAEAGAKAPVALMDSISSFGYAALIGGAAFVAAMALTGGFRKGGFTGTGADDQFAGPAHRNEFVFSAPAVRRLGVENLQAMQDGAMTPAASPAGAGAREQRIVILSDERRLRDMEHDPAFETMIVRINERNKWRTGA